MGTLATLVVKHPQGHFISTYVQADGYPAHTGKMLINHYNSSELAIELISLGELSVIYESAKCPPTHSFQTPVPGHTIAYGRDRNEPNTQPFSIPQCDNWWRHVYTERFTYLWNGDAWYVNGQLLIAVLDSAHEKDPRYNNNTDKCWSQIPIV